MLLLLMLFALEGEGAVWQIESTEVFQPLLAEEVIVRPDGHVYVLNFRESYIRHFDEKGAFLGQIGRRGKGPGEFTYPTQFFFLHDQLYVFDALETALSTFAQDGTFISRTTLPDRRLRLARVNTGWLYGDWDVGSREGKAGVYFTENQFDKPAKLLTLQDAGYNGGTRVQTSNGVTEASFSPLSNHPRLITSPDGKAAYIVEAEGFVIHVYDAAVGKIVHTIRREERPIPFDTDWANERLKEEEEWAKQQGVTLATNFPEYFPIIRRVMLDHKGNIVVDRWRGRPDDTYNPVAIDSQGNEVPLSYPWEILARIGGYHNGHAIITLINEEDSGEAGLAKVALGQLKSFVQENPIVFDGRGGRSISISE